MDDIGQELRQTREQLNLSIEEISERTMIPKKYLIALEEEKYKVFPGEVYLKGALRQYADELGLNPKEMIDLYYRQKDTGLPSTEKNINITPQKKRLVRKKKYKTGRIILFLLIIMIIACGIYAVLHLDSRHPSANPQHLKEKNEGNNLPPDSKPGPGQDQEESPENPPVKIVRDSSADNVRFLVSNSEMIEIELKFSARCWIRISTDGVKTFEGNMQAGEKYKASAAKEIEIRIGFPPAVTLTVNGQVVELPVTEYAFTMQIVKT